MEYFRLARLRYNRGIVNVFSVLASLKIKLWMMVAWSCNICFNMHLMFMNSMLHSGIHFQGWWKFLWWHYSFPGSFDINWSIEAIPFVFLSNRVENASLCVSKSNQSAFGLRHACYFNFRTQKNKRSKLHTIPDTLISIVYVAESSSFELFQSLLMIWI